MRFNQDGAISSLNDKPVKLVDKFTYLSSNISSTESDITKWTDKVWTAIDSLSTNWKSDISNKIKQAFFKALVKLVLLYGYTT